MKNQSFVLSIDSTIPNDDSRNSRSLSRKWKRLTQCQKRILIVFVILIFTLTYVSHNLSELKRRHHQQKKEHKMNEKPEHVIEDDQQYLNDYRSDERSNEESDFRQAQVIPPDAEADAIRFEIDPEEPEYEFEERDENSPEEIEPVPERNHHDTSYGHWRGAGRENGNMTAVKDAFLHAWKGYSTYALGHDMLKPLSHRYEDWFTKGNDQMALTLIDSLDTMLIMNLTSEFKEARMFVKNRLSLQPDNGRVNLFECTIRVLGGFISTYYLTGDELFKEKALDIGDRLLPAITSSKSSVPYSDINLRTRVAKQPAWGSSSSTSEVTTIQMEFGALSYISGDRHWDDAVRSVSRHISRLTAGKLDGLVPLWIDPKSGEFSKNGITYTMGARTDSYYEYLFKRWYQSGKNSEYSFMVQDFQESMEGVKKHLFGYTEPNKFLFVGEKVGSRFSPKMDHLVCFLPGTLALAVHEKKLGPEWLEHAEKILETCHQFYVTETGLAPEISYFNIDNPAKPDLNIHSADRFSILRPETVESYFYLWRLTKNQKYRDWGWEFFQSLEKFARVEDGYTSISNVESRTKPAPKDKMESFFLGETLKYLYLLFSDDDMLPLSEWVFNTEAHPFRVQK